MYTFPINGTDLDPQEGNAMADAAENQPPIEELFNPHSREYMLDPVPQCLALARRGPLVWYEPWQAWIVTRMDDIMACWKEELRLGVRAPAPSGRPVEQLRTGHDRPQSAG